MENKKITYVVYLRNSEFNIINTLESILIQNTHITDYNVIIIDDYSQDFSVKRVQEFIKKNKLINFNLIQLNDHLGISGIFSFLSKSNLISSKYVTFLNSGDVFTKGWMNNFLLNMYRLNYDMYLHSFKLNLHYTKTKKNKKNEVKIREYVKKSSYQPIFIVEGEVEKEHVISSKHFFFGKIYKWEKIKNMRVFTERILYQDFYMYQKMISLCETFFFSSFICGEIEVKDWVEEKMDKERIILLCKTLDKMISKNNLVLNGLILKMLAISISHTQKIDYYYYIISNYANFQNKNFKLTKVQGLDICKRKIKKYTKNIIETGKIINLKNEK